MLSLSSSSGMTESSGMERLPGRKMERPVAMDLLPGLNPLLPIAIDLFPGRKLFLPKAAERLLKS